MKRFLALTIVSAALVAIPASQLVFAKGHVPTNKTQVCHKGTIITIGIPAAKGHVKHGDKEIDVDTFTPPFFTGDFCDNDALP